MTNRKRKTREQRQIARGRLGDGRLIEARAHARRSLDFLHDCYAGLETEAMPA